MRLANSSQPYFSCNSISILSRVIPCKGSFGMGVKKRNRKLNSSLRFLGELLTKSDIESIQVHHLVPSGYKIMYELRFGRFVSINFRDGSQF